jgi:DNA-binding transcriptional regulator YiaG
MANVAKVLKEEISRVSRKEAKSAVDPISKSNNALKKTVIDLKKRVAALEKENKRLLSAVKTEAPEISFVPSEGNGKRRITSRTIRSLRNKLGLTQADFARLAGVTPHSVYLWENKEGPLSLRERTHGKVLSIKEMGAKEAKEKLVEGEATN